MSTHLVAFACLLVLVVYGFQMGAEARSKPEITPKDEVVIQEGDKLRIECRGQGELRFVTETYTVDVHRSESITSYNESSGTYEFIIPRAAAVDTGWYACAEEDVEIINNDQNIEHSSKEISWLYVYVNSTEMFSVRALFDLIRTPSGDTAVIPCLPTSPDRIPQLFWDSGQRPSVPFTPRIGFIFKNVGTPHYGFVRCTLPEAGIGDAPRYILSVYDPELISPVSIRLTLVNHVVRGQDVILECQVMMFKEDRKRMILYWDNPAKIPVERLEHSSIFWLFNRYLAFERVRTTIRNVTDSDQGVYTCTARVTSRPDQSTKKTIKLTVSVPKDYYINYVLDGDAAIERHETETIVWKINIDSYPKSNITWFGNNGLPIPEGKMGGDGSRKYLHKDESRIHWFKISDLKLTDGGAYVIRVTTEHQSKDIRLNLTVLSKPVTDIVESSSFNFSRKPALFTCRTTGSPLPNVTWSYTEYPNLPSRDGRRLIYLSDNENRTRAVNKFTLESRLNVTFNASGYLTCKTCNKLTCTEATQQISLSDVGHPFQKAPHVTSNMNASKIVVHLSRDGGQSMTLTCDVTGKPKPTLIWFKDDVQLTSDSRFEILADNSTLHIGGFVDGDAGRYSCRARNRIGAAERYIDIMIEGVPARRKPKVTPERDLVIQAGDELRIECRGQDKIKFVSEIILGNVHRSEAVTSYNESSGTYEFIIPRATAADTGWYACAEEDVEIINNYEVIEHSSEEISWLYVYVNSTELFSVKASLDVISVPAGGTAVIPCLPTSPDRIPVLNDLEQRLSVPFTPRIGFILNNVGTPHYAFMRCTLPETDITDCPTYILSVHDPEPISPPSISTELVHHVVRGQDVTLQCTVMMFKRDLKHIILYWDNLAKIPVERLEHFGSSWRANEFAVYKRVRTIIRNVTDSDQGVYTCTARVTSGPDRSRKTSMKLTVSDPEDYYINYVLDGDAAIERHETETTVWKINIDSYPKSNTTWFGNNGLLIPEGEMGGDESRKYSHKVELRDHWFGISDLKLTDGGAYVIRVTTEHQSKDIRLNLTVLSEPVTDIVESSSFYFSRKPALFTCRTTGSPLPNVTWSYTEYPNLPSRDGRRLIYLSDNENRTRAVNKFTLESRLKVTFNASGYLTCKTCNKLTCTEATQQIPLSDVGHPFQKAPHVTSNMNASMIVVHLSRDGGQSMTFRCDVTGKPKPTLIWLKDDVPLTSDSRFEISADNSTLHIGGFVDGDAGRYSCRARNRIGAAERYIDIMIEGVPARRKPKITPERDLVIQAGDELRIECRGQNKIKFVSEIILGNVHQPDSITSHNESSGTYEFIIPRATAADTGWYACAEEDVEIINNYEVIEHSSEEISWLYVYVNSTEMFSLKASLDVISVPAGGTAVIPCLPTSPDQIPVLDDLEQRLPVPFTPRIGFILRNVDISKPRYVACSLPGFDGRDDSTYILTVHGQ